MRLHHKGSKLKENHYSRFFKVVNVLGLQYPSTIATASFFLLDVDCGQRGRKKKEGQLVLFTFYFD